MKYYILTLGCQMNRSDSERVRTVVEGMGYRWTDNEEEADLLGILACSVRQKSIDKVYSRISRWNKWKNHRSLITFVSGCVLPADREKFLRMFDMVFTISELPEFPDMVRQYGVSNRYSAGMTSEVMISHKSMMPDLSPSLKLVMPPVDKIKDFWNLQPTYVSEYEAFIPIQNGCDKFCTFCAVPYTRGREISRPSAEILAELKQLVNKGYKAITLLGQNVNSYGKDKHGEELSFPGLLKAIGEYGNDSGREFWVYFTSPHPRDMSDDVLEVIASYDCLAKQIHLPVQSGDDKVLIRMNRKHSVSDYKKIIDSIRRLIPSATIFTDIIVGFTGETDAQFENTRKLMEAVKFNMAYIAIYSPRPGAASSRWDNDIPIHIKKERLHILTRELTAHTSEYNRQLIGKRVKILVTGRDRRPGYLSGMTEGRIVVRFASSDTITPGNYVWLDITSAAAYSVEGKMVNSEVGLQMTV